MQAGVSVMFTLCQVDPLFEREGEMGGQRDPIPYSSSCSGHNELKVAISKVLTVERWGGSKKQAALNES